MQYCIKIFLEALIITRRLHLHNLLMSPSIQILTYSRKTLGASSFNFISSSICLSFLTSIRSSDLTFSSLSSLSFECTPFHSHCRNSPTSDIYAYIHTFKQMGIYIKYTHTHTHIYIYIYTYIYTLHIAQRY